MIWGLNLAGPSRVSFVDAMFTSTSAVCVTGLTVLDTGGDLSPASQAILLCLIQLGGMGVMTAATTLLLLFRQKIGIRQRLLVAGGFGLDTPAGAVRLLVKVVQLTIFVEFLGFLPLFYVFSRTFPTGRALFLSIFHSVSAFCNAGFSPFSSSLEAYSGTFLVPGVVMLLIFFGGIGFLPVTNLYWSSRGRERLSFHTRFVLWISFILIILGTLLFIFSEAQGVFAGMHWGLRIWNALFQSITARTAGFNTIKLSEMSGLGLFILSCLMIIGASPGSTGGGIKTSTIGVLWISAFSYITGKGSATLWNRSFSSETTIRALTIVTLYIVTIVLGTICLSLTETFPLNQILFETISALGTVGLSMGITPDLSLIGKLLLIVLMFWGRVGMLSLIYSMMRKNQTNRVSFAEISIPTG